MSQGSKTRVRHCRFCRHFRNDPAFLEDAFKGLTSLGSGHASTRGEDGLCTYHDRYVGARANCGAFADLLLVARPDAKVQ